MLPDDKRDNADGVARAPSLSPRAAIFRTAELAVEIRAIISLGPPLGEPRNVPMEPQPYLRWNINIGKSGAADGRRAGGADRDG